MRWIVTLWNFIFRDFTPLEITLTILLLLACGILMAFLWIVVLPVQL